MDSNIVKTRLGHYLVPGDGGAGGYEHTALVVFSDPLNEVVNITCWDNDGDPYKRVGVQITGDGVTKASFHLVSACPRDQIQLFPVATEA